MSDQPRRASRALRFVASGGMAEEVPDVVRTLLTSARTLAERVLAEPDVSDDTRAAASSLLEQLDSDAFGDYES